MALKDKVTQYKVNYPDLLKKLGKGSIPNNILLFTNEKILLDEIVSVAAEKFLGEKPDRDNVKTFFSGDRNIEGVMSECSNISFFTQKKIILLKVLKRAGTKGGFTNQDRQTLINYIKNYNQDIVLMIVVIDREFNFDAYQDFLSGKLAVYVISPGTEKEFIEWAKIKFTGYKIDEDTIYHLLQFLNPSYDEINSEIEKLKTYCFESKEITKNDINMCIGFSRDFDEFDLLEAVLTNNYKKAIQIYNKINLKEDKEVYIVSLFSSSMISINKLFDPEISKLNDFNIKRELRLWKDADKRLRILKEYKSKINELKLNQAFDYIYNADKALKSTASDKKEVILSNLIYQLTNL